MKVADDLNQIRVHLAAIGHPVVGDRRYGQERKVRMRPALHAKSTSFAHPVSGEPLRFDTKVPGYFIALIGFPMQSS
jgi:23S rRNA-/tRNA-specific pseudouridylate synthase